MKTYLRMRIDNEESAFFCPEPEFHINKELNTMEDMLSLTWEDVEVRNYVPLPDFNNKPKMAI